MSPPPLPPKCHRACLTPQLRKENGQLKMENSQLFKELDILNRKVRTKFGT
jgi:hypothetical protein